MREAGRFGLLVRLDLMRRKKMAPAELGSVVAKQYAVTGEILPLDTIGRLFERQVDRAPNRTAVQINEDKVTYGELDRYANQLARRIRKTCDLSGSRLVALCFERSIEMIVAMLAVVKAGAGYVPIDPAYPAERIRMTLEDAGPALVLTQPSLVAKLPLNGKPVVCLDRDLSAAADEDGMRLQQTASAEGVAYVIYTSGSTGTPKGVMVTHHNVNRLLTSTSCWFDFNTDDVWTLFHSSAFDFSVWEIWGCLLTGGKLICVPYWVARSPRDFYALMAKEQVTVLNQTPAAFYQLIQVEESGFVEQLKLRYVIFGGEALNFASLRPWFHRHGDRVPQLINMYGITETTVHVTYRLVTASDAAGETRSLIGTPIPDLQLHLLGSDLRPVPDGDVGEIYVGGAGVSKGYLNRPELTAERFVTDPFSDQVNARLYRSGDLARRLANGDVEYLGRGDMQVKIRGFRIELGEIEAALADCQGVQQAVVLARKDGPGEPKLVGYYLGSASAGELRDHLVAKLPEHMVPHTFVRVDAFPLTINGKIDRAALPAPALPTLPRQVEPGTQLEAELAVIWRQVLEKTQVGFDDNFFDLGGDSLLLAGVQTRLQALLQAEVPITDLFEFPTIRSLARRLELRNTPSSAQAVEQRAMKQRAAFAKQQARRLRGMS
ncbi:amino acid adenylation domain-containing protein [Bradyrhizobium sp. STM 3843]|uniref:amino acid adenylation domain-containing protein n=1 Tax=Bradyrhizobium sp. STM 3843 TaxID=551947 RepID=UPI001FCA882A|nr:amino acid adenylation domain-containing protein [Bradyrhizobium sp. STM 3843]